MDNNNSGRGRASHHDQPSHSTPRRRTSSSSPPRGLREAYARIEYEEELAAAESPPDDFGDRQIDWSGRHLIYPRDTLSENLHHPHPVLHPSMLARPPPAMGSPRTRLPAQTSPEHTLTMALEDSTMGSGSGSPSVISGLSSLENGTEDSFVRTMAQHQRDQQRVSGALGGDQPVFSRAHHVNGVKDDKLGNIAVAEKEVMEGSSNGLSEVGNLLDSQSAEEHRRSRDRASLDLIKKVAHEAAQELTREGENGQQQTPGSEGNETSDGGASPSSSNKRRRRRRNRMSQREKLQRLRDDGTTRGLSSSKPGRKEPSMQAESVDQPRPSVENEIGEEGTTVVTPITKAKMTVLERIREREMEKLKGQAVATSRLNQLGERSSKEQLRPRQSSVSMEEGVDEKDSTAPEDDEPAGDNQAGQASATSAAGEANDDEDVNNNDNKPDARDLLRQLARAASNSPSPKMAAVVPVIQQQLETVLGSMLDTSSEKAPSTRPREDTQSNTNGNAANDVDNDYDIDDGATPRAEKPQPIPDVTPAVAIGGWINTPGSTNRPSSPSEATARRPAAGSGGLRDLIRGPVPTNPAQHKTQHDKGDSDSTMEMLDRLIAEDTLDFATSLKVTEGEIIRGGANNQNKKLLNGVEPDSKATNDALLKRSQAQDRATAEKDKAGYICAGCGNQQNSLLDAHHHHNVRPWHESISTLFSRIFRRKDGRLRARWAWFLLLTFLGWLLAERVTWYVYSFLRTSSVSVTLLSSIYLSCALPSLSMPFLPLAILFLPFLVFPVLCALSTPPCHYSSIQPFLLFV